MSDEPMVVEVWSDVVCPWCCIGRATLLSALGEFEHDVEVVWRSFELDPGAPAEQSQSLVEQLGAKYGVGPAQVESMFDDVRERAHPLGLDLRFEIARPGNTFDAHRLLHLARTVGRQDAVKDRFFRAYFTEGEPIGNREALARLAVEAGLDAAQVSSVLASDRFADDVRADEAEARAMQVSGVPFFVIDRRYAVAGAQPAEVLVGALRRAHADREVAS